MEIQQHDGVVVDVAGLRRATPSFCKREREVLQGRREAPEAVVCCPPSPLYIGPLGRGWGAGQTHLGWGRRPRGVPCPPRQVGSAPTLGFATLGAWGEAHGGRPAH